METDWAENRAEAPTSVSAEIHRPICRASSTEPTSATSSARASSAAAEPGTVEIYISHRGSEQVPTVKMASSRRRRLGLGADAAQPGARGRVAERLMVKFGTAEPQATQAVAAVATEPARARLEEGPQRDESAGRRRCLRPRVAARRSRARPHRLHRRRPRPLEGPLLRALFRSGELDPRRTPAGGPS